MAATSRGIDVSNHQAAQDWKSIARGGVTFAFIKASEGTHTHDARYRAHMDGILSVPSLLPGAYHYAHPNQDAHAEADNYTGVVGPDADRHPGFVHWLDLERRTDGANYAGMTAAGIRAYAEAWITRVRAAFPHQRVGVYTSGSDIKDGHYPRNADALWYPAYPAGAMSYTAAEQRTRPAPSGVRALFWQFTSTPIDRSICYLTPDALRTWAGAPTTVREDPLPAPIDVWAYKNAAAAKRNPALPDAYGYLVQTNAAVKTLTAQLAALTATVGLLAKGGTLTAAQITSAAEAGARAALTDAVVHVDVDVNQPDAPAPAKP